MVNALATDVEAGRDWYLLVVVLWDARKHPLDVAATA
jgi:hypothetical protein